jgi:hypothetical protein
MKINAITLLEKLERDHAQTGRDIAQLRQLVVPVPDQAAEAITDWINTGAAAEIARLSVSRVTTLCGENRIGRPDGFARKLSGQWDVSASLWRAWLHARSNKK